MITVAERADELPKTESIFSFARGLLGHGNITTLRKYYQARASLYCIIPEDQHYPKQESITRYSRSSLSTVAKGSSNIGVAVICVIISALAIFYIIR